jgi:deazaflavin-dependent oxidoreductase (nitroreductase family)
MGPLAGIAKLFNRLALRVSGTRLLPLYAVMEHRGRRSGKTFRTPVVVRPTAEGFVVPMPWGLRTDWCRNVKAAGECIVRWKGRDYAMVRPEMLEPAEAAPAFSGFQRAALGWFGIVHFMRLSHRRDAPL